MGIVFGILQIWVCHNLVIFLDKDCRVRCTECNVARAGFVACSVFDIWEGQEWVSDHVVHVVHVCTV